MLLAAGGLSVTLLYAIIAFLVALSFHEASHALVADRLGDDTAKKAGRLSLNPLAHLDLWGTLMILLLGVGWGKPVMIDGTRLRYGPKIGMALVAIAGPITNFLLAAILAIPLRLHLLPVTPIRVLTIGTWSLYLSIGCLWIMLVSLNLSLALFNLIPISPLDGSRLWQIILPDRVYFQYVRFEIIGILFVVALVLSDIWFHTGILERFLLPALNWLWYPLVGWGTPFSC